MEEYDISAIEYIFDNYSREKLFSMDDDDLKDLIWNECNELSSANEYIEFGTYGKHFELDIDFDKVYNYILEEKRKYNGKNQI